MPDNYKVVEGVWVTIRGNGTVEIPVVETARKDVPPDYLQREDIRVKVRPAGDPSSGRGKRGTLFYLQSQFGSGGLVAGDHCTHSQAQSLNFPSEFRLVWRDNERALNIAVSKKYLAQKGVNSHNFVKYFGAYTSPVDNSENAEFRARINRDLSQVNQLRPLSGVEKLEIIRKCYYDYNPEAIRHYFTKTGLIGDTPPRQVISNLIFEATEYHTRKFNLLYRHQLLAYVRAANHAEVQLQDGSGLIGPWWDVIRENK